VHRRNIGAKLFVMLAIFIILFQSFSIPILASVKPWTGNPWTGDSWSGDSWNGSDLEWEGDPWSGNSWNGNEVNGGNGWQGSSTTGGNGWQGDGTTGGNSWQGNGWQGNGPTGGNGWTGLPGNGMPSWSGNQWSNSPWYLDPWQNPGWNTGGNGPLIPGQPPSPDVVNPDVPVIKPLDPTQIVVPNESDQGDYSWYDWTKFGIKDIGFGTAAVLASQQINFSDLKNWNPKSKEFYLGLLKSSYKFSGKDIALLEVGADALDIGENYQKFSQNIQHAKTFAQLSGPRIASFLSDPMQVVNRLKATNLSQVAGGVTQFGANTASKFSALTPLAKFNVVSAAVGAGFSAVDSVNNIKNLWNADTKQEKIQAGSSLAQSSGEFLMNVGAGVAAFPGGQVIGGALVVGGAVLWAGGTIVKHWSTIKDAVTHPIRTIKNTAKAIGDRAKKAWSTVKGWFS
jgi:hypothetical protein